MRRVRWVAGSTRVQQFVENRLLRAPAIVISVVIGTLSSEAGVPPIAKPDSSVWIVAPIRQYVAVVVATCRCHHRICVVKYSKWKAKEIRIAFDGMDPVPAGIRTFYFVIGTAPFRKAFHCLGIENAPPTNTSLYLLLLRTEGLAERLDALTHISPHIGRYDTLASTGKMRS